MLSINLTPEKYFDSKTALTIVQALLDTNDWLQCPNQAMLGFTY
ncbi:hypothetical protein [Nostoc sp.]|nr:hypothetical protein [Nostoc sp. S13]